ncbi:MAG: ACT domain-containing protein [Eubacteriales bacterium]|nr:ACT domain-containing protein [Eubacteriales bacterium]
MAIKQLSVFVENKIGQIASLTGILSDADINFRAAVIAETTDFGIFRCIIEDPEKAQDILQQHGFNASLTDVIPISISDVPGALSQVLQLLAANGIDTKYLYSAVTQAAKTSVIILKTSDTEGAEALLKKNGIRIFVLKDLI